MIIDIISQLRKLDGKFARGEQRVADFVLGNLERIAHMRLQEIAVEANVSVATVNRFCQTVGYNGFKDFKITIAQSVAVSLQYLGGPGNNKTHCDTLVTRVFSALVNTLNTARNQLQDESLEQAIEMLASANRIIFMGVGGGSANVAQEGANRFFRLGIPAEAHSDGYFQRMLASTLHKGDVLFAISSSGSPIELLDSVVVAQQYGAGTISLTHPKSALAAASDVAIGLDLPEDEDIFKPTASRLVFMATIDVIAMAVAQKHPERVKENLRRIRTTLITLSGDTSPRPIGD
ncbi:MAG: RpiR family transcriptional regulator [Hyphomicrobiales bacterium]|nr:MAG: RpiR family transcriptional regulator [Hyphomicrobiales bacterium]